MSRALINACLMLACVTAGCTGGGGNAPVPGAAPQPTAAIAGTPSPTQPPQAAGGEEEAGDRVTLSVLLKPAKGGAKAVTPFYPFRSGDAIRFKVSSTGRGHLYLLLKGTSGRAILLYPDRRVSKGANSIDAGREVVIPSAATFKFDRTPGSEMLYVIFSRTGDEQLVRDVKAATGGAGGAPDSQAEARVLSQIQSLSRDLTGGGAEEAAAKGDGSFYVATPDSIVIRGRGLLVGSFQLNHYAGEPRRL
jgi:hypothetical protein